MCLYTSSDRDGQPWGNVEAFLARIEEWFEKNDAGWPEDHDLITGSRLVIREQCGHGSRWRLDTFISEVEKFLDDVEAGRPVAGERRV